MYSTKFSDIGNPSLSDSIKTSQYEMILYPTFMTKELPVTCDNLPDVAMGKVF